MESIGIRKIADAVKDITLEELDISNNNAEMAICDVLNAMKCNINLILGWELFAIKRSDFNQTWFHKFNIIQYRYKVNCS